VRDARIAMIYEGANGVQALDLVGRKLPKDGGRALRTFIEEVNGFTGAHRDNEKMVVYTKPLRNAVKALEGATMWLMQNGMKNPDNAGAASTDYMHLMGLVTLGYMWALMAEKSLAALDEGANCKASFHEGKLATARYFMERILPETQAHLARIESGAESMMALDAEAF
jgi:hypothetical protein